MNLYDAPSADAVVEGNAPDRLRVRRMLKTSLCILATAATLFVLWAQAYYLFLWHFGPQVPSNRSHVGFAMVSVFFVPAPLTAMALGFGFRRHIMPFVSRVAVWTAALSLLGASWVLVEYLRHYFS